MNFVTHLPQTSRGHYEVWVIVDQITKLAHFLVVQMTCALEEFCRLYIGRFSGFMEYQYL